MSSPTPPLLLAQAGLQFLSPLAPAAWLTLGLIPLGIVLLYFLKLRRRPVQVPSTLLWKRSLEDLHVNSLFQRLRKNLLLFLQLAVVGLILMALAGPRIQGLQRQGRRLVLAIDESASMAASDVTPTRLDAAKREARKIVGAMGRGDVAMLIAFSESARVVANYTENKDLLLRRIDAIRPTDASTSLREALQLVAGLANPQKYLELGEGTKPAEAVPPRLFVITDGGFPDVEGFQLGNIQAEVLPVGPPPDPAVAIAAPAAPTEGDPGTTPESPPTEAGLSPTPMGPPSDNVAILALSASRDSEDTGRVQLFGRVRNHRAEPESVRVNLYRRNLTRAQDEPVLVDALDLALPARGDEAFQFDLSGETDATTLEVRLDLEDALALDNRAYAVIEAPRRARVLLVTTKNRFLSDTLETEAATELAEIQSVSPEAIRAPELARELSTGGFDLVILDNARADTPPECSTLSFGTPPVGLDSTAMREVANPVVLDWDLQNPIMQYVRDLNTLAIRKAQVVEPPPGARVLIEGDQGPLAIALPRGSFQDVYVAFGLIDGDAFNTNWPLKASFPLFVFNALRTLGGARAADPRGEAGFAPGPPVPLRLDTSADQIEILDAAGRSLEKVSRSPQGAFVVGQARRAGLYQARWGDAPEERDAFAVNLFDARESDLSPRGQVPPGVPEDQADAYRIKIGFTPIESSRIDEPATQEWWWALAFGALGVVLAEWFVYNRRVHV